MSIDKDIDAILSPSLAIKRRSLLKACAAAAAAIGTGGLVRTKDAAAFAYRDYPTDNALETVVTSCAHNCGSRHVLVAHKKGNVIVRLRPMTAPTNAVVVMARTPRKSRSYGPVCVGAPIASASIPRSGCSIR